MASWLDDVRGLSPKSDVGHNVGFGMIMRGICQKGPSQVLREVETQLPKQQRAYESWLLKQEVVGYCAVLFHLI